MKILIGENIKRLRRNRNITQEQLAEALHVTCAAVSKWERGETYPDITLLQPAAYFFGVSLDELMGYDAARAEEEISEIIEKYSSLYRTDYEAAGRLIQKAQKEYPNDFRIMHLCMWYIAGDYADNSSKVLLAHKAEFSDICRKIIEGCGDRRIRLDALNMQAKLLWAEGRTEDALAVYKENFSNWYETAEQKSEQLFAKDTPEFLYWVRKNLYELASFAADKAVKAIFFDTSLPFGERLEKAEAYGDLMDECRVKTGDAVFAVAAEAVYGRLANDLTHREGDDADIIRVRSKHLKALNILEESIADDTALRDFLTDGQDGASLLKRTVDSCFSARTGRGAELLKNPEYVSVLRQYAGV